MDSRPCSARCPSAPSLRPEAGSASTDSASASCAGDELANLPLDLLQRGKYQPRVDMRQESLRRTGGVDQVAGHHPAHRRARRRWRRAGRLATLRNHRRRTPLARRADRRPRHDSGRHPPACPTKPPSPWRSSRTSSAKTSIRSKKRAHSNASSASSASRISRPRMPSAARAPPCRNLLRLLELAPEITRLRRTPRARDGSRARVAGADPAPPAGGSGHAGREARPLGARHRRHGSRPSREGFRRQRARKTSKALDPNVQRLQDELTEKLGAPVQIQHTGSGKGKVVVSYHSLDELDGILAHIR